MTHEFVYRLTLNSFSGIIANKTFDNLSNSELCEHNLKMKYMELYFLIEEINKQLPQEKTFPKRRAFRILKQ